MDELTFDEYEGIPATIIDYSPQERFEYIKPRAVADEYDEYSDQIQMEFNDEPIIYTTYTEVCRILKNVANQGETSSFDVLEEALEVEEKVLSAPLSNFVEDDVSLSFEEESKYSEEAFRDAELMLKEILTKK